MKGDPTNPADWQKVALTDLARARKNAGEGDLGAATLWLEQSAEKVMKGWLIGQGWTLVKTHDLERLCNEVQQHGVDVSWFLPSSTRLRRLYFTDRYFDASPDLEPDEAECLQLLAEVEQLVSALFPPPA
jgi:HEPN domain-containing protein